MKSTIITGHSFLVLLAVLILVTIDDSTFAVVSVVFPDINAINLRWIFGQTNETAIQFLAYHGLLQNKMACPKCIHPMGLTKRAVRGDGFEWRCQQCNCRKSIRTGSFFTNSMLPMTTLLPLLYMWVEDFRNKNAVKELDLAKSTVVDWFNFCRQECKQIKRKRIGGPGTTIEIDETCWVKQKHHRGRPKRGTQQWYFGCIERGAGGQAIAARVKDRTQRTLFKLIKKWIKPGTRIISDEWPAYLSLEYNLPEYTHMLIRHKKKTGGGFAKKIKLADGRPFNVNTNKCEGLWSHLKHKTKRLYGTSTALTDSYMYEQLFRQNTRAQDRTIMEAFVDVLRSKYCQ